jgi:hypothetical protein
MGSDASEDLQPIERPSCPVPGQSRMHMMDHSHSTISTLTNSMGSDITVHNTEAMVEI